MQLRGPCQMTGRRGLRVPSLPAGSRNGRFYAAGHADGLFDEADLWLISLLYFLFFPFGYLFPSPSFLRKQVPFLNFQWGHYGLTEVNLGANETRCVL